MPCTRSAAGLTLRSPPRSRLLLQQIAGCAERPQAVASSIAPLLTGADGAANAIAADLRPGLAIGDAPLGEIASCMETVSDALDASCADGTLKQQRYAWRFWEQFCTLRGTTPWRTDEAANRGLSLAGTPTEAYLQISFVIWSYQSMTPRRRGAPAPQPQSAWRRLYHVRRRHELRGLTMFPVRSLAAILRGMMRLHDRQYPGSLVPRKAEPFRNAHIRALCTEDFGDGAGLGMARGSRLWLSLVAMVATATWAGFRLSELVALLMRDVSLRIDGVEVPATRENFERMQAGRDYVVIRVRQSKCDPFGIDHSPQPIYFLYELEATNAAAALRTMCLENRIGEQRDLDEPIFTDNKGAAVSYGAANRLLRSWMPCIMPQQEADKRSWHSFRSTLCSRLVAANVPEQTILRLLRWRSVETIKKYGRLGPAEYAAPLAAAGAQEATATQARYLPTVDWDADQVEALTSSFAARATCEADDQDVEA